MPLIQSPFHDLHLSISNDSMISTKTYDMWEDFNFDILYFLFLDGDVPLATYLVYEYFSICSFR